MLKFFDRYGRGVAIGVGLHLLAAVVIGYVSFKVNTTPPNIMEVTLAGGGGGGQSGAAGVQQTSAPVIKDKDAIVDKNQKPTPNQDKQATNQVDKSGNANSQGTGNGTGTGSGTGSGSGSGSGNGIGSGHGDGVGSGSGSGVESPTVPPRLLSKTNPRYPLGPRSRNITGTSIVKLLVNDKGRVESAQLAGSSGNGELDEAALECVYKWKFSPAKNKMGNSVMCYITIPIKFTIN